MSGLFAMMQEEHAWLGPGVGFTGGLVTVPLHCGHFAFSIAHPDGSIEHQFAIMLSQFDGSMFHPLD